MSTVSHRRNVISGARQASTKLLDAAGELKSAALAWDLIKADVLDGDFAAEEGVGKTDINQALGPALSDLQTFLGGTTGKKLADIAL